MKPKPPISDDAIAQYAYNAGFRGQALVTAVAVAIAESSGRTDAKGDEGLQTAKWGPSVGLWQIRSVNAEYGTGGQRDAKANLDPATNARHAYQISKHGRDFTPWATYNDSLHVPHLGRARAAAQHAGPGHQPAKHGNGAKAGRRIIFDLKELAKFESLMDTSRNRVTHSLRQVQDIMGDVNLTGEHGAYLKNLFDALTGPAGLPLVVRHLDWETHLIQRIRRLAEAVDGENRRLGPEDLMLYLKNLNGRAGLPEVAVFEAILAGSARQAKPQHHPREPKVPAAPAPHQQNYGNIVPAGLRNFANGRLPDSKLVGVGEGQKLTEPAAKHFRRMDAAARAYGVDLRVNSGYRTVSEQAYYYQRHLNGGPPAARPGSSTHGWGLSVDLDVKNEPRASEWLRKNGASYGFFNDVTTEPWHWTYRPR